MSLLHVPTATALHHRLPRPTRGVRGKSPRSGHVIRAVSEMNGRRNNTTVHKLVDYFGAITIPGTCVSAGGDGRQAGAGRCCLHFVRSQIRAECR